MSQNDYPDKETVIRDLEPLLPLLQQVFYRAWDTWLSNPVAATMEHKRVRADVVWNNTIAFLREGIDRLQRSNINLVKACRTKGIHLQIDDERGGYFIRCKKANRLLLSSNYPTQHAMDFHDPQVDMFGGVSRLELVYVIDKEEISVERVALVKRVKNLVIWFHELSIQPIQLEAHRQEEPVLGDHGEVAHRVIVPRRAYVDTGIEAERIHANGRTGVSNTNSPRDD